MINIDLTGKTALITGGGQGLGLAIAECLYAAGAHVHINYFPDAGDENKAKAEAAVQKLGDRAALAPADVRDGEQVRSMFAAVCERDGIDIVVNNAGILRDRSLKKMSQSEWQDVIDTNLTGVFNVSQSGGDVLKGGGRIINIASVAAMIGFYGQANYVAAKSGVIGLTKVLSRELAKRSITANAVAPGVVMTEMGQSIPEANREVMLSQIPLGRFAEPEEIANVVAFLASDLASYITGHTVHVNGGWFYG